MIDADVNSASYAVARLLSDGALDPDFGSGGQAMVGSDVLGTASNVANALAIDAEGRIIVAGTASDDGALIRLLKDGSLDTTFGNGGLATTELRHESLTGGSIARIIVDHAGRLVAAGLAYTPFDGVGEPDTMGARFSADGALDATFGGDGVSIVAFDRVPGGPDYANGLAEQPDGKLVLVGEVFTPPGERLAIAARLDEQGGLDPSFGDGGTIGFNPGDDELESAWLTDAALQDDRVIAVGGCHNSSRSDAFVVRFRGERIFAGSFE